jgi:hypothetical protein
MMRWSIAVAVQETVMSWVKPLIKMLLWENGVTV